MGGKISPSQRLVGGAEAQRRRIKRQNVKHIIVVQFIIMVTDMQ